VRLHSFLAIAAICLLVSPPVWADFDDGIKAYERGDYETALREWTPLAEEGDPRAQLMLGVMHSQGEGVTEDINQARHFWLEAVEAENYASVIAAVALSKSYSGDKGDSSNAGEAWRWFYWAAERALDRMPENQRTALIENVRGYIAKHPALRKSDHGNFSKCVEHLKNWMIGVSFGPLHGVIMASEPDYMLAVVAPWEPYAESIYECKGSAFRSWW